MKYPIAADTVQMWLNLVPFTSDRLYWPGGLPRQAVEPAIGHLKSDNRMDRCWLRGQLGDALHAVLCATGYNLRWLLRAMARLGLKAVFLRPVLRALMALINGDHARFTSGHQNFRLAGAPG